MGASQRVSRGFHRLALLFGVIIFIVGGIAAFIHANASAERAGRLHKKLVCAEEKLAEKPALGAPWDNDPSKLK
jgi:hypothetical protein